MCIRDRQDNYYTNSNPAGRAYVVFDGGEDLADIDLSNLTASQGFEISGGSAFLGGNVSFVGDVNGDGLGDVIVTDQGFNYAGNPDRTGGGFIVYGRTDGVTVDIGDIADGTDTTSGIAIFNTAVNQFTCLLYTSPSPRDRTRSRMPSSA